MSIQENMFGSLEKALSQFEGPVLIVSSAVGAGNISIGEAVRQRLANQEVSHFQIERFLPAAAVEEDNHRYKFISNHFNFLLHAIYRVPFFYQRKLFREEHVRRTDLSLLANEIKRGGYRTVIAVSHRQAFWLSLLKKRKQGVFQLYGVLTEFGTNLGWRYLLWDEIDGFISPLPKDALCLPFSQKLRFIKAPLLYKKEYADLAGYKGKRDKVLFVAGFWGQVSWRKAVYLVERLLNAFEHLQVTVVCGTNQKLFNIFVRSLGTHPRLTIFGQSDSLCEMMKECASIITKPGFSTLVEAHAACRQIFLLKGMPVAEEHNASYALSHFGAKRFSVREFGRWYLSYQTEG